MAYWGPQKLPITSKSKPFTLGDGENLALSVYEIKKSEASYSRNTSSRKYPALSVCPGRVNAFAAVTTPNAFGVRANQYPHFLDGTTWKRWDGSALQTVLGSLTNARGRFIDYVNEAGVYTILMNGTDKKAWDGTNITTLTEAPATRLFACDDYRVYALKDNIIYHSAEGSYLHWDTGLYPNDANKIPVTSMKGPGTAITASNDVVVMWSDQSMHTLYGNDTYDSEFGPEYDDGCISDFAVINDGRSIYFLDFGAFKVSFDCSKPEEISQKVKPYLDGIGSAYKNKCAAGKSGKYIYLAIPYQAAGNNMLLEFDTETGNWYPQTADIVDFININESFYGITSAGQPLLLNSGTDFSGTAIPWEHTTGILFNGVFEKKVVSNINAIIDLPTGSTLNVYANTSVSGGTYDLLYTFTAGASVQNLNIKIPTSKLQNIDWYRLKFEGAGPCTIHYIGLEERIKTR
jgi:hypothetical protein